MAERWSSNCSLNRTQTRCAGSGRLAQALGPTGGTVSNFKHTEKCFCCGTEFQFGPHIYDGKHIPGYGITVCRACYEGNWDGWAPHYEVLVLAHLKNKGIEPPARNSKGWLPRDWPVRAGSGS